MIYLMNRDTDHQIRLLICETQERATYWVSRGWCVVQRETYRRLRRAQEIMARAEGV